MREPSEVSLTWQDAAPELRFLLVEAIGKWFRTKSFLTITRILDMANPAFTLVDDGLHRTVRIDANSLPVLNLLIKTYLFK